MQPCDNAKIYKLQMTLSAIFTALLMTEVNEANDFALFASLLLLLVINPLIIWILQLTGPAVVSTKAGPPATIKAEVGGVDNIKLGGHGPYSSGLNPSDIDSDEWVEVWL